uniref:hypothetical protein n=1 Tax=Mycolicibacterium sp. lyk4-40-TYG-92 TaxID=3040295 RepID=UPI00254DFE6A
QGSTETDPSPINRSPTGAQKLFIESTFTRRHNAQAIYIIKGGDWGAARQDLELSLIEVTNDLPPDDKAL